MTEGQEDRMTEEQKDRRAEGQKDRRTEGQKDSGTEGQRTELQKNIWTERHCDRANNVQQPAPEGQKDRRT